jgi:hypothetical protein
MNHVLLINLPRIYDQHIVADTHGGVGLFFFVVGCWLLIEYWVYLLTYHGMRY